MGFPPRWCRNAIGASVALATGYSDCVATARVRADHPYLACIEQFVSCGLDGGGDDAAFGACAPAFKVCIASVPPSPAEPFVHDRPINPGESVTDYCVETRDACSMRLDRDRENEVVCNVYFRSCFLDNGLEADAPLILCTDVSMRFHPHVVPKRIATSVETSARVLGAPEPGASGLRPVQMAAQRSRRRAERGRAIRSRRMRFHPHVVPKRIATSVAPIGRRSAPRLDEGLRRPHGAHPEARMVVQHRSPITETHS